MNIRSPFKSISNPLPGEKKKKNLNFLSSKLGLCKLFFTRGVVRGFVRTER